MELQTRQNANNGKWVVGRALGREPMSNTCLSCGDKESLSPTSQPMYLRALALTNPAPQDSVEQCLFGD